MFEARGMIHSEEKVGVIKVHEKVGDNDYIVETPSGIFCHALYNFFNGLYYADDLYRKEDSYTPRYWSEQNVSE